MSNPLVSAIQEIYNAVKSGNQERLDQAMVAQKSIHADPNCVPAYLQILSTSTDLNYRSMCANALLRGLLDGIIQVGDANAVVNVMLELISKEANIGLSTVFANIAGAVLTPPMAPLVLQYAQTANASNSQTLISAALTLLSLSHDIPFEELEQQLPFFQELIVKGFSLPDQSPVIDFGFILSQYYPENPFFAQFWQSLIQLFVNPNTDINALKHAITSIAEVFEAPDSFEFANPIFVIDTIFPLICNEAYDSDRQELFVALIDVALDCDEAVDHYTENPEVMTAFYQKYFALGVQLTDDIDSEDVDRIDVWTCLGGALGQVDEFVTSALGHIGQAITQDIQNVPTCLLALSSFFGPKSDAIIDNLDQIVQILAQSLVMPGKLVRSCGAEVILRMSGLLEEYLDPYLPAITEAIVSSLQQEVNERMIQSFDFFLSKVNDTDPIFEPAYAFLGQAFMSSDPAIKSLLFPCISSLCQKSQTVVKAHFDEVYGVCHGIISDAELGNIHEDAILCLTSLANTCVTAFTPHVTEYAQFLVGLISSQDIEQMTKVTALKQIGSLFMTHSQVMGGLIEALMGPLLGIGSENVSAALSQELAQRLERMDFSEDDSQSDLYSPPAVALNVITVIFSKFPGIMPNFFNPFMEAFKIQENSNSREGLQELAHVVENIGCTIIDNKLDQIMSALFPHFVEWCTHVIQTSSNADVVESACNAIVEVLCAPPAIFANNEIQNACKVVDDYFHQRLTVQRDNNFSYVDNLTECITNIINEAIDSFAGQAWELIGPAIWPSISEFLQKKKAPALRIASLRIAGHFVQECGSTMNADLLRAILNVAIEEVQAKRHEAVYVINQFSSGAPPILQERINDVMQLLCTKLQQSQAKKNIANNTLSDTIVACLAEIQHHILREQFPPQLVTSLVELLPAKIDPTSNFEMYLFLIRAATANLIPPQLYVAAIARLFVQDDEIMGSISKNREVMGQLIQLLQTAITQNQQLKAICDEICGDDVDKAGNLQRHLSPQ